jgi:hypothetical protein
MINKSLVLILTVLSLALLPACKSNKKSESGSVGGNGNGNPPPALQQLDLESITDNNFFALVGFDFSSAVVEKYKLMEGTSFETPVKRFSYFFSKQQLLNNEKLAKNSGSYCELYIETNPKTQGSDIQLRENARLRLGAESKFVSNNEVSFNLVLQQSVFEQFQLFCVNTLDVDEVNEHIGHILFITKDSKPFPKVPKVKKIGFYQDSFGVLYSKSSQTVVVNASFDIKDLTKSVHNGVNQVAWRICDPSKDICISDWQFLNVSNNLGSIVVTMELSDKKQINQAIKRMGTLEIQLSVDSLDNNGIPRLTHTLDVGNYCNTHPENFFNADFNTIGCP